VSSDDAFQIRQVCAEPETLCLADDVSLSRFPIRLFDLSHSLSLLLISVLFAFFQEDTSSRSLPVFFSFFSLYNNLNPFSIELPSVHASKLSTDSKNQESTLRFSVIRYFFRTFRHCRRGTTTNYFAVPPAVASRTTRLVNTTRQGTYGSR